jgi:Flp pilus assembly protein TadG
MRAQYPFLKDERGAVAAEFALVIGFVMLIVFAVINGGLLFYTFSSLHMAVEDTARWASIRTTVDGAAPSSSDVQDQGLAFYKGATAAPAFAATAAACGMQVTATATYTLPLGIGSAPLSMGAASCYPLG